MLGALVTGYVVTCVTKNTIGAFMRILRFLRKLPVFIVICILVGISSPAAAQEKGKGKAKGKQKIETNANHGREATQLPYGLERHTEKKGELPSGLQKKKDEDGQLTRGLEEGGKDLKPVSKRKKVSE